MKVHIVGLGPGNPDLLTGAARTAIQKSELLIGARRMLEAIASNAEKVIAITPKEVQDILVSYADQVENAAVIVSGDVGFYSAALELRTLPFSVQRYCGISSLQYLCAASALGWEDVQTISLHGRAGNLVRAVRKNAKTFVLTDQKNAPNLLCAQLCQAGMEQVEVIVGENLSYPTERLVRGKASALRDQIFAPLNALLVLNEAPMSTPVTHGLPDEAFVRGDAPMTKEEVRALSIARLGLRQGMCVWDIGAGTGSVAVEVARVVSRGTVWAVERDPEAIALLTQNQSKFFVSNLEIVAGEAPEVLCELPAPDAVFIGGSGGEIEAVITLAVEKNPLVRVVVNAILLETATKAAACIQQLSLTDFQMTQLGAARARKTASGHMMLAQNPIYILSAGGVRQYD